MMDAGAMPNCIINHTLGHDVTWLTTNQTIPCKVPSPAQHDLYIRYLQSITLLPMLELLRMPVPSDHLSVPNACPLSSFTPLQCGHERCQHGLQR